MNERISAAIVRLDEAEAFGGIKPFYCASGHVEPFQSIECRTAKLMLRSEETDYF
ncbi:hypothetical protein D3C72_2287620 [compost metagenome]